MGILTSVLKFTVIFLIIGTFIQVNYAQHSLRKLPYPINDPYVHEICPIVSNQENFLFFTRVADPKSEKTLIIDGKDVYAMDSDFDYEEKLKLVYSQIASKPITDPMSSSYNQDIWYTMINDTSVAGLYHPGYPINCVLPNSICSKYPNENTYIVINQFKLEGGIDHGFSLTTKIGDDFTFPIPITIEGFNKASSEVNLTASSDGKILVLAQQSANGSMDLYISYQGGKLSYSPPIALEGLNTIYRETTPWLSEDGNTLFFASDRPGGYGGQDIWFAQRESESYLRWSTPSPLLPPVNTISDESHPHLMKDNNTFYFTSSRDGSSDIFKAQLKRDRFDNELYATITLISTQTNEPIGGELHWGDAYVSKKMDGFFRSKDGICKYIFYKNKPVRFYAENRNLKSDTIIIDPQEWVNKGEKDIKVTLFLDSNGKIYTKKDSEIKLVTLDTENEQALTQYLRNIYFEKASPNILETSLPSIRKIANILKNHPTLHIRIDGHTDNVGVKKDLKTLSNLRAEAIRSILLQEGIEHHRVGTHGFGDTKPIAPNDTEENKSKNRRVEITILAL
ncbi:MAG: OmpA family protein [Saprospiraceae bacterium]